MAAYFNEFDPFAAQWLRELIKAGHIAPGDVDDRSILDVSADDLRGYDQCHFFAGIGVWSYSLRRAGWSDDRPVWTGSCPCQPLSVAGLGKGHADERHLWPAFHRLIAECRPAIVLGEQVAGKDGREWYAAVRADLEGDGYACGGADLCAAGVGAPHIRQRLYWLAHADRQQWNGSGHAGAGRRREPADDRTTGGMAHADVIGQQGQGRLGYPGHPAPGPDRQVDRAFHDGGAGLVADAGSAGPSRRGRPQQVEYAEGWHGSHLRHAGAGDGPDGLEHTAGDGRLERRPEPGQRGAVGGRVTGGLADSGLSGPLATIDTAEHPARGGQEQPSRHGSPVRLEHADHQRRREAGYSLAGQRPALGCPDGGLADPDGPVRGPLRLDRQDGRDGQDGGRQEAHGLAGTRSEVFGLADAINDGQRQHRGGVGGTPRAGEGEPEQRQRLWPDPADGGADGRPSADHTYWADADWLYCRDGKWRPVEPGTFPLAHGAAARVGRLRGYGNAINAETAKAFIQSVMDLS